MLRIVALGHKMPAWIKAGFGEYAKRLPPETLRNRGRSGGTFTRAKRRSPVSGLLTIAPMFSTSTNVKAEPRLYPAPAISLVSHELSA